MSSARQSRRGIEPGPVPRRPDAVERSEEPRSRNRPAISCSSSSALVVAIALGLLLGRDRRRRQGPPEANVAARAAAAEENLIAPPPPPDVRDDAARASSCARLRSRVRRSGPASSRSAGGRCDLHPGGCLVGDQAVLISCGDAVGRCRDWPHRAVHLSEAVRATASRSAAWPDAVAAAAGTTPAGGVTSASPLPAICEEGGNRRGVAPSAPALTELRAAGRQSRSRPSPGYGGEGLLGRRPRSTASAATSQRDIRSTSPTGRRRAWITLAPDGRSDAAVDARHGLRRRHRRACGATAN